MVAEHHDDAVLWAYACELRLREQGKTHGPAVHELWRQLAPNVRKRLTADQIWNARERLRKAIQSPMVGESLRDDSGENGANAVGTTC